MFHLQLLMVALIIIGVTLMEVKKGGVRKFALYSLLTGCVIGTTVFAIFNMYVIALLAVYGAGMTIKSIHHTY